MAKLRNKPLKQNKTKNEVKTISYFYLSSEYNDKTISTIKHIMEAHQMIIVCAMSELDNIMRFSIFYYNFTYKRTQYKKIPLSDSRSRINIVHLRHHKKCSLSIHIHCYTFYLFGVTYISPQGSVYADDDPFSCIQTDIDRLSKKYNYLCMFGDWNSRTK